MPTSKKSYAFQNFQKLQNKGHGWAKFAIFDSKNDFKYRFFTRFDHRSIRQRKSGFCEADFAKNVAKFQIVCFWNWRKMQQICGTNSWFSARVYQRFCGKNFWLCDRKRDWCGGFDTSVRESSQGFAWTDYYEFTRDFERKWNFFAIPIFSHEQKCDWKNFWRKNQTFVRTNQFSARFHL